MIWAAAGINTLGCSFTWMLVLDVSDKEKADKVVEEPKPFEHTEVKSAEEPIVAADGHVVLSQEDIDARDQ